MGVLAIFKSRRSGALDSFLKTVSGALWAVFFACTLWIPQTHAEISAPTNSDQSLEKRFIEARQTFESSQTNFDAAWKFARLAFDWGDVVKDRDRAAVAESGIAAARTAISLKPSRPEGHYYLGLNLGQLARTKTLGALRLVKEMEKEFKVAIEVDPGFDFAGAYRSLGILYVEAPGWPASIGDRTKGRETLQKAVDLHPEYPDNQISLAEACLKAGNRKELQPKLEGMQKAIESARTQLREPEWKPIWADWDKRWQEVKQAALSGD